MNAALILSGIIGLVIGVATVAFAVWWGTFPIVTEIRRLRHDLSQITPRSASSTDI